jgi:hypothetical protein
VLADRLAGDRTGITGTPTSSPERNGDDLADANCLSLPLEFCDAVKITFLFPRPRVIVACVR